MDPRLPLDPRKREDKEDAYLRIMQKTLTDMKNLAARVDVLERKLDESD
jgi:hypothetical protein